MPTQQFVSYIMERTS